MRHSHKPNWLIVIITILVTCSAFPVSADILSLTIAENVTENTASQTLSGIVSADEIPSADLLITIESSDTTEILIPGNVTLPAGSSSVSFDYTVLDDAETDGAQTATISATAVGWQSATGTIIVNDNDPHHIAISEIPTPQTAGVGFPINLSVRTIDDQVVDTFSGNLNLSATGDSGTVPVQPEALYEFMGGTWSGTAIISALDNNVVIQVDAGNGVVGVSNSFSVVIGATSQFSFSEIASPQTIFAPFNVTITAEDSNGYMDSNYSGIADLMATYPVGTGTSLWSYPLNTYYTATRTQSIYLADQINYTGTITGLGLNIYRVPGGPLPNWTIRIRHTDQADYSDIAQWEAVGWTTVYQADETITETGWKMFQFSEPFEYDGQSNLMIDFSFNNSDFSWGGSSYASGGPGPRSIVGYSSGEYGDPLTWSGTSPPCGQNGYYPNIKLLVLDQNGDILDPLSTSGFVEGEWNGDITVKKAISQLSIVASDGSGVVGSSDVFDVDYVGDLELILPDRVTEGDGELTGVAQLSVTVASASDLEIVLSVSGSSQVSVPASVIIPGGQTSASFMITVLDDLLLDGPETTTVSAYQPLYTPTSKDIVSDDNEDGMLVVDIPSVLSEDDGFLTDAGTVTVNEAVGRDLEVALTSSLPIDVRVPSAAIIPEGQLSANFYIYLDNNNRIESSKQFTITASVPNWATAEATGTLEDDETTNISITLPPFVNETDGSLYESASVSISGVLSTDLQISLVSDDTSELTVPDTVVIPAGQTSAMFVLTVMDDSEVDGTQTVTITASADGFTDAVQSVNVNDNDPGTVQFSMSNVTVSENSALVSVSVVRVNSTSGTLTVDYATSDISAVAGEDYTAVAGTLTFNEGETEKTIDIPLMTDWITEGEETFTLILSNPGGGGIIGDPSQVTITMSDIGFDSGLTGDDRSVVGLPIGFDFNYWGTDYSTFGVCTNGWLRLGGSMGTGYSNPDFPMTTTTYNGILAPFFDDLRMDATGQTSGKVLYMTVGSAPDRKLVIQYVDVFFYGSNLPMGTFETILYESTGEIKFQYRYLRDSLSFGSSATIGIDSPFSDAYVRYSYNTASLSERQAILFTPDGSGGYTMDGNAPYAWIDISGMTLGAPNDGGAYAGSEITFEWEVMVGANAYRLEIATAPDESSIIDTIVLGNVNSYIYSDNFVEGDSYFARIAASLNGGETYQNPSEFSDGVTIDLTAPTVNKPTAVAVTGEASLVFTFTGSDNYGIGSYIVQIASDSGFSDILHEETIGESGTFTYGGTPEDVVFARGIAIDYAGNQSDYSDVSDAYTVPLPPPSITSISPSDSQVSESVDLTIQGDYLLDGDTTCSIGTTGLDNIIVSSRTSLSGTLPAGTPVGTFDVTCTTFNGTGTLADAYTVLGSDIAVTPSSNYYGIVDTDAESTRTFTVTNNGNTTLELGTITIEGQDALHFILENDTCSATTLDPSATCSCEITFSPDRTGSHTALVKFTSNDFDTPEKLVGLTGTGTQQYISLTQGSYSYEETDSEGSIDITVQLQPSTPETVTVGYATVDGTAIAADDYTAVSGTLVFNAGETIKTITVPIAGDTVYEASRTFTFQLSNPVYADAGTYTSSDITIYDNDNTIDIAITGPVVEGQSISGTVTSVAPVLEDTIVYLSVVESSQATIGQSGMVTILSGESTAGFDVTALDNDLIDGTRQVTLNASASGLPPVSAFLDIQDDETRQLTVVLPATGTEGTGSQTGFGSITLTGRYASDITVTLSSGDTTEAVVPSTVLIPADNTTVTFDMDFPDDTSIDGDIDVAITASSDSWLTGTGHIVVNDDENRDIVVSVPETATEGDNVLSGAGSVTISGQWMSDLVVNLESRDPSEVSVNSSVTIPAGDTSAVFDITVLDDSVLDFSIPAEITATATEFNSGSDVIRIIDNEVSNLSVTIPETATEGDTVLSAEGHLELSMPVDTAIQIQLESSDTSELTVPATVEIPAGQTRVDFDLTVQNDSDADGSQTVTVTAFIQDVTPVTDTITIHDDSTPPSAAVITEITSSGALYENAGVYYSANQNITMTGTGEAGATVMANGAIYSQVNQDGQWSLSYVLTGQGLVNIDIVQVDPAGNQSEGVIAQVALDTAAPQILSVTPGSETYTNNQSIPIEIEYNESLSGVNTGTSQRKVINSSFTEIEGTWTASGTDTFIFTPDSPLSENRYSIIVQLEDNLGNRGSLLQSQFYMDLTPPPAPEIVTLVSPTHNISQVVEGKKESWASLTVNGSPLCDHTQSIDWSYSITHLASGENTYAFIAQDRAGNSSAVTNATIFYDDIPPQVVAEGILTADGNGSGTTVALSWSAYDETLHGDIDYYRIYVSTSEFSDVTGMMNIEPTVEAGNKAYTVTGLTEGNDYWFAVVPVDIRGNANSSVIAVMASPTDMEPPGNAINLTVVSGQDTLTFNWEAPSDAPADFNGYKAVFASDTPVTLDRTTTTFTKTGLSGASAYDFVLYSLDDNDPANESTGTMITGYTFLDNPTGLTATAYSSYVDLSWNASQPSEYVDYYRIYVVEGDGGITSVAGLEASKTADGTSTKVAGLTDNTAYSFAVSAVNLSKGEKDTVTSTTATPVPDQVGPVMENIRFGSDPVTAGMTITVPGAFSLSAIDAAGVSRVEMLVDGTVVNNDYNGKDGYAFAFDIFSVTDGTHTIGFKAYDTLGNESLIEYNVTIAMALPGAPVITSPQAGSTVNAETLTVKGTSEKQSTVTLFNNSVEAGTTTADSAGQFSLDISMSEGVNSLQASSANRAGTGPLGSAVDVTLDTTLPLAPESLTATAKEDGQVRLAWRNTDTDIKGFDLYRSTTEFTDKASAVKVNTTLITALAYTDLPGSDNTWYYRAVSISIADNESALSNQVSVTSDETPPTASVDYVTTGNTDPNTGAMAPGIVDVTLTVSEPLLSLPFFSITPDGGYPITVILTSISDTVYTGSFEIQTYTPTADAYAVFSGRDMAGNRGTVVTGGSMIKIDTDGPKVKRLDISPADPIRNDEKEPVTITAEFGLDERIKEGDTPVFSYILSGEGRVAEEITSIELATEQWSEAQAWRVTFTLPADAGLSEAESLTFIYSGTDNLDNVSDDIDAGNTFQVYQGDLPPLEIPTGLTLKALSGGRIRVTWSEVPDASSYQLYRQSPSESELAPYGDRMTPPLEYIDVTLEEGTHTYAVASVRSENGQDSESPLSTPRSIDSDATAPSAPTNLTLELYSNGILARWDDNLNTETVYYRLYRAGTTEIVSLDGLTPILENIASKMMLDSHPSPTEHCYTVTAVDLAGNESEPAPSFYLNFGLLPVAGLTVSQSDNDLPVVSWTYNDTADLDGFDLYLGDGDTKTLINTEPMQEKTWTDTGYTGAERTYTVIAVDNQGTESLPRTVTLPKINAALTDADEVIYRNIMNLVDYTVTNTSGNDIPQLQLIVTLAGIDHLSETVAVSAGETVTVPVAVGGYASLGDVEPVTLTTKITQTGGETAIISRSSEIEVREGSLSLRLLNEDFTRGGTGKTRFVLENTGEADIEIITAYNNKSTGSILFFLVDEDGNVLSSLDFSQSTGDSVVTLSDKTSVARIPAGESFVSDYAYINVPASAPDTLDVELEISDVYSNYGQESQVSMDGMATSEEISLVDTSYYGTVTDVTPASSFGDEDIVITGEAIDRVTLLPVGNATLNLVITLSGFERAYSVLTASDGTFTHTFRPNLNEAGIYQVRATHPDLKIKPVHATFTVSRVTVSPKVIGLKVPKNYEQPLKLSVYSSPGCSLTNARIDYLAEDQASGSLPEGIHLTPGAPVSVSEAGGTIKPSCVIWADNGANATETIVLRVISDDKPEPWGKVTINAEFTEAKPVLWTTPNLIETGVAADDSVTETLVIENRGLAALNDITLSVLATDGSAAPSWISLNSQSDQGTLEVGESREIAVMFAPTESIPDGIYNVILRIESSNADTRNINLYASVTRSGIGSALFKVEDIYTGTLNDSNQVVQGLNNAKITLQNESVITETHTLFTDNLGEALFSDLPAGYYKCRISADSHQEKIDRLWIKPGITTPKKVFLDYNLVTVEWSVEETTIEDEYTIVLSATFETDVPAPVVVMEPVSVRIPADMEKGDVFNGEITLTNYGLVTAENVSTNFPQSDDTFKFEFLNTIPENLTAKQYVRLPYRLTALKSLSQDEDATGGGCTSYRNCASVSYDYSCANGDRSSGSANSCWSYSSGCTTTSYTGVGSVGTLYQYIGSGGGTGTGGTYTSSSSSSTAISGTTCPEPPPNRRNGGGGGGCKPNDNPREKPDNKCKTDKDSDGGGQECSYSTIDLLERRYLKSHVDLDVKVNGDQLTVERRYKDYWYWPQIESINNNVIDNLLPVSRNYIIEYEDYPYEAVTMNWDMDNQSAENIFISDEYKITVPGYFVDEVTSSKFTVDQKITRFYPTGDYLWEDNDGIWKKFSGTGENQGLIIAQGNKNGLTATFEYDDENRMTGILDRNDNQVIGFEYDDDGKLVRVYSYDGRSAEYAYNPQGRLETVTDVLGYVTEYVYNADGRLIKTVYPNQNESRVAYDEYGYVTSVLDKNGVGKRVEYDFDKGTQLFRTMVKYPTGKIKEVWFDRDGKTKRIDINGTTVKTIDIDGRNEIITDKYGNKTIKEYNEFGNITRIVYPDNTEVRYEYDSTFHRISKMINENGVETQYQYDDNANMIRKISAVGTSVERTTDYTYDDAGNRLTEGILADANSEEALTQMEYDDNGNMVTLIDPEGHITRYTYDAMGNVLTREDPRGKIWTYTYDGNGKQLTAEDPLGHITRNEYDMYGKRIKSIDAFDKETTYEYDSNDNLVKTVNAMGGEMLYEYDFENRLIKTVDPEGVERRRTYDMDGNLKSEIDGNGNEITYVYEDASGETCSSCSGSSGSDKPSAVIYPTYSKEFTYDKRGRIILVKDVMDTEIYEASSVYDDTGYLISETDKEGKATTKAYDELNRLVKTTDALGKETLYSYDNRDNLITLTDAEGNITRFEYNLNNRVTKEIRPMGEETSFSYDAADILIEKLDPNNQKTVYTYDDAMRLESVRYYAAGDHANPVKTVTYAYDQTGKMMGYDDGTTSAEYFYDDLGRKTSETVNYGPFSKTHSYSYYDNALKKTFTGPDGITYDYTYDAKQIKGVTIPGKGIISWDSYTWMMPESTSLPGGTTKTMAYDSLMRLKEVEVRDPARTTLMSYQYSHDRMNNITAKETEHGNYNYGYDDVYRLVSSDNPGDADEAFTYDRVGNRLTGEGDTTEWIYSDNNELESRESTVYSYDTNGNLIQKVEGGVTLVYSYTIDNRLERVEDSSGSVKASYGYDPFGRRLWKETGGLRTYYYYADEGLVAEFDQNGDVIKTYGYKPGSGWTTDPLFMKIGDSYYYYQNDHLGTPQKLSSVSGDVVWSAKYDAFGSATVDVYTVENNLRFPGQYYDAESGLHNNWNRYYDPSTGRYLTPDPIGIEGGINLYGYVTGNPVNYFDTHGLEPECFEIQIASIVDIKFKINSTEGKCPYNWMLKIATKLDKFKEYVTDNVWTKECGEGKKCKKNKMLFGIDTYTLNFNETLWWNWKKLDVADVEVEGYNKCTFSADVTVKADVVGYGGSCECIDCGE